MHIIILRIKLGGIQADETHKAYKSRSPDIEVGRVFSAIEFFWLIPVIYSWVRRKIFGVVRQPVFLSVITFWLGHGGMLIKNHGKRMTRQECS